VIHGYEREGCPTILAHNNDNKRNLVHVGKDGLIFKCYISTPNLHASSFSFDFVQIACDYISNGSCNGNGSP
jgi:hypothetical protein